MPATAKQPELVQEMELRPKQSAEPSNTGLMLVIELLAARQDVDVSKLEKIIELHERVLRQQAKAAFDGAYARLQSELPEVTEHGQILVKGVLRSTYARLEDIHASIKPVLKTFGFAIRHRTEWPLDRTGIIRIVGILSHEQGHSEESVFEAPMDRSDFRTDIQSMGSTVSYGRRYTTLDLLNIATRGADDDGRRGGEKKPEQAAPAGYEDWLTDMAAAAEEGWPKLSAAFGKSKEEYRRYVTGPDKTKWAALRAKAEKR